MAEEGGGLQEARLEVSRGRLNAIGIFKVKRSDLLIAGENGGGYCRRGGAFAGADGQGIGETSFAVVSIGCVIGGAADRLVEVGADGF